MKLLSALALVIALAFGGLVSAGSLVTDWLVGGDPHHALPGPPGALQWPAAVAMTVSRGPVPDPATASVEQVQRFFAGLTGAQRDELALRAPGVVGNLDGAPYRLRYAANERARRTADPRGPRPAGRLLAYDPRGDGRMIEVLGELASARHIAVIVPGSGWRLANVLRPGGGAHANPARAASALRGELRRLEPGTRVAVVVWLGYDTPEGIDLWAARSERALAGARALSRFLKGLPRGAGVSLLCHSYGAVVCGRAAPGAAVDNLVALAAPGMDVSSAAALRTAARVWAARDAGDPIRFVPHLRLHGFGHGQDPTDPGFGALAFRTGPAHGHDVYYAPGSESLANLARIVLGRDSEVTLA